MAAEATRQRGAPASVHQRGEAAAGGAWPGGPRRALEPQVPLMGASQVEPSPEESVKQVGLKAGALVVGLAAADAFNEYVPAGHRPEDFLPGARSVVVAGAKGPTAGAWRSPNHEGMEVTGYDFRENITLHAMADFIERELGYYAIQAPSLPTAGHQPPMSMMLAAVLAGLGTRSLAANIILHPEDGRLYYAAQIGRAAGRERGEISGVAG